MDSISLLREKFTIRDVDNIDTEVTALGNRLQIDLPKQKTPLIIRGHSMHITLRYGAEILRNLSFVTHVESVQSFLQWDTIWERTIASFEKDNVPDTWITIYYEGHIIFQSGHHHTFFDLIEQCEHTNTKEQEGYSRSILRAQKAFVKMGKDVLIEEESNIGFILEETTKELRFAIILRLPQQKATFITRMAEDKDIQKKPFSYVGMKVGADFIEAINLAVRSGFMDQNIASGNIAPYSDDMKTYRKFQKRLGILERNIAQAERQYIVKYRPERPDFKDIQKQTAESD